MAPECPWQPTESRRGCLARISNSKAGGGACSKVTWGLCRSPSQEKYRIKHAPEEMTASKCIYR